MNPTRTALQLDAALINLGLPHDHDSFDRVADLERHGEIAQARPTDSGIVRYLPGPNITPSIRITLFA